MLQPVCISATLIAVDVNIDIAAKTTVELMKTMLMSRSVLMESRVIAKSAGLGNKANTKIGDCQTSKRFVEG